MVEIKAEIAPAWQERAWYEVCTLTRRAWLASKKGLLKNLDQLHCSLFQR